MNSLLAANVALNNTRRRNCDENDVKYTKKIIYLLLWISPYIVTIIVAAFILGCF